MNKAFYNILIFCFAVGVSVAFSVSTITIGSNQQIVTKKVTEEIVWSKITPVTPPGGGYDINTEKIENISAQSFSQNTPILVDFGRLSSFLYNSTQGSQSGILQKINGSGILIGEVSGIVSLYDLFMMYTIYDNKDRFRIDQITNGSFYIGKEKEENGVQKISIYAIDGVARLTFLYNNEEMTSLVLFPGSYIRFDPSRNRSLKGADLFRTILSLKESENEVFEFVNPRVNIGQEDAFFNYRLSSPESMRLFRILSAQSRKRVEATSDKKRKINIISNQGSTESQWLLNPSKKDHNMLVRLSELLSHVITKKDSERQITEISKIYNEAKNLKLKDATAKGLVEQFLLDGRFEVYGGVANSKYQAFYEQIGELIGIKAGTGQSRLLQSLADIYSRNLFSQNRTEKSILIDTYTPTAGELTKTLDQNDVYQKEYFDIAIYAFNILRKMERSVALLNSEAMTNSATYSYFVTFFRAANRYIESITDLDKKQQTIMSFSRQFYDYILTTIVNSLYKNFTIIEDKALYLARDYREGIKVKIPDDILNGIQSVQSSVEYMTPSIDALWTSSGQTDEDTNTIDRIHKNIVRLRAFMTLIDSEGYKSYAESPYQYDDLAGEKGLVLPQLNEEGTEIVRLDKKMVEKLRNQKIITTDPRIAELKKIWTSADASNWGIESDNIRIIDAPYQVARTDGENSDILMSFLYKDKTFTEGIIKYGDRTITVYVPTGEFLTISQLYGFLSEVGSYLDTIDTQLVDYTGETGEIRMYPLKQRVFVRGSIYPVAVGLGNTKK
ncbi:MAG: hypothetical protein HHAS10_08670 [Candidatus Altimarinota bacterium]